MVASISEAKNRLSALIDHVRSGETVLIVDRGIPVARLESAAAISDDPSGRITRLQRAGIVRAAKVPLKGNPLKGKPPRARGDSSVVRALLDERRAGH